MLIVGVVAVLVQLHAGARVREAVYVYGRQSYNSALKTWAVLIVMTEGLHHQGLA